ncbi:hypothetical protein T484DRAFT_2533494 [Baffinella frigidus]|nr:hypothetical protein T484DRAFT_2533494 [Cryptophyta sp. CCMP2293]
MPLADGSTPPRVVALSLSDNNTFPALGPLFITAFAFDPTVDLKGRLRSVTLLADLPDRARRPNPVVVLIGASEETDEAGVAVFAGLAVAGFDRPDLVLAFTCQGFVLVWSEAGPTNADATSLVTGTGGEPSPFHTLAAILLPTPPAVVASMDPTAGVTSFSGDVVEGVPFQISISLPPAVKAVIGSFAGAFLVVRASPRASALQAAGAAPLAPPPAFSASGGGNGGRGGRDLLRSIGGVPTNVKQYRRRAITGDLEGDMQFYGDFSTHGAVGDYEVNVYLFGALVGTTGAITVRTSVYAIIHGDIVSDFLCGQIASPVCRHHELDCKLGTPSAISQVNISDSGPGCYSLTPLRR